MSITEELIAFEQEMSDIYCAGKIKAPVHLSDSNEEELIKIFENVNPLDWVYSTWRSHYHALLHGVPKEMIKKEILAGNSITLHFPDHKFFASAIVGGVIPIALGTAMAMKRQDKLNHVWCFVGDMTAETGGFYECLKYAGRHDLPITFVIEDNGESVGTPTKPVWGIDEDDDPAILDVAALYGARVIYYQYTKRWPHVGSGKFITF